MFVPEYDEHGMLPVMVTEMLFIYVTEAIVTAIISKKIIEHQMSSGDMLSSRLQVGRDTTWLLVLGR